MRPPPDPRKVDAVLTQLLGETEELTHAEGTMAEITQQYAGDPRQARILLQALTAMMTAAEQRLLHTDTGLIFALVTMEHGARWLDFVQSREARQQPDVNACGHRHRSPEELSELSPELTRSLRQQYPCPLERYYLLSHVLVCVCLEFCTAVQQAQADAREAGDSAGGPV